MAKVQAQVHAALQPTPTKHRSIGPKIVLRPSRRRGQRGTQPRRSAPGRVRWQAQFLQVLADEGFEAALVSAGIPLGHTVFARLEDVAFRQAVERIGAERLATAELKLVDLLLGRLTAPDVGEEKAALLLWQNLREERRKPALRSGGEKGGVDRAGAAAAEAGRSSAERTAERAAERAAEVARLIGVVEARLAAAEADGKTR